MKFLVLIFIFLSAFQAKTQCWNQVSAGYAYSLAIADDGTLWGWGDNGNFQLANGTKVDNYTPFQISTDNDWVYVYANNLHHFAIKQDSTLWAWGIGYEGEIGNGCTSNCFVTSLIQIGTDKNWEKVQGGQFSYSIGLKNDGTLWAWGGNDLGVFGDGTTTTSRNTPAQIGNDGDWIDFTTDWQHLIALKNDGTIWGTGANDAGQLGIGNLENQSHLNQIGTDKDWVSVSTTWDRTFGVKSNGTLWGWGRNYWSIFDTLIALGTLINEPIQIGADTNWISIKAGYYYAIGLQKDSTVWAWGDNSYGQLGNGTLIGCDIPTQIPSFKSCVSISAGYDHVLCLIADKTTWAWGGNWQGQIGDGTEYNKKSPIQIGSPCLLNLNELSAQTNFTLYPNPTNETANIRLNQRASSTVNIEIHDLTGKVQQVDISTGDQTNYRLNVANLAQGLYLVKVSAMGESITKQLIIN